MPIGYAVYHPRDQPLVVVADEELLRGGILSKYPGKRETVGDAVAGRGLASSISRRSAADSELAVVEPPEDIAFEDVSCLMLSYRGLRRLTGVVGVPNITRLQLDNNRIQRIEGIDHLRNLVWLDLSFNEIVAIEGLDGLTKLQNLSLFGNRISSVTGVGVLQQITTLSLGNNPIDSLDDTVRLLHKLNLTLRVLTLKGTPMSQQAHYRSRTLAFLLRLRFLDGRLVYPHETASAREENREMLLPIDEEDESTEAAAQLQAVEQKVTHEYERRNCPNEATFFDSLYRLEQERGGALALLGVPLISNLIKGHVDQYKSEFDAKAKELAEEMKAVQERREADDEAFNCTVTYFKERNAEACRALIKDLEVQIKRWHPEDRQRRQGAWHAAPGGGEEVTSESVIADLYARLDALQTEMLTKEAELYNGLETVIAATMAKWRSDAVDMTLQTTFEAFARMELDFQNAIRHELDLFHDEKLRQNTSTDMLLSSLATSRDSEALAVLDSKEEYHKILNEWYEVHRKRLEELELMHTRSEEKLLAQRAETLTNEEAKRHRTRVVEIAEYVKRGRALISAIPIAM